MAKLQPIVYISAVDYLNRAYELATQCGPLGSLESSYYISFSRYVLSIRNALPVSTIILAQSPYNRNIYPGIASAMSFDENLTEGTFQEVPATVEVLANDISRTCNCGFWEIVDWFRDSWMYVESGVLVLNTRSVTEDGSHAAEREAARLLGFLKVVVEASANRGVKTVTVFTLGNPAKDFGDKLRSCVDTTSMPVTVKSAAHPAYISRRHSDLRSPECTLDRPSFCRALFSVIMATRKAQEAAKERERELLVKDLNLLNLSGLKVANSYSEYVAMLESDAETDVIPKSIAIQMLTSLRDSIIDMCASTRNVATFVNLSSAGVGGDNIGHLVAGGTTRPPQTDSRVPPGEMRSSSTPSRAGSVATDASKKLTPAEIRKRRQRAPGTAAEAREGSVTSSAAPATPTPKPSSARAQRMASRPKASAPVATAESHVVTDAEAGSMGIMAEYMANNHDEPGITEVAEQLMACVETRDAKSGATADALKAIRADASKDSKYEAGMYLGLGSDASIVTSNTYQFCTQYPDWTFKA